ncbi:hypothetical protein Aperf_G00000058509 [Anoplocephala perfoliata]
MSSFLIAGTNFVESRFLDVQEVNSVHCGIFHSTQVNPMISSKSSVPFLTGFPPRSHTLPSISTSHLQSSPSPSSNSFDLVRPSDHLISNILNHQGTPFFSEEGHRNLTDDFELQPYACKDGIELFNCPLCSTVDIATRAELTSHLQQHQNNQRREDGKHVCCFCSSELSSNSSLERHLLTHTNHRPFACSLCDKAFTTNGNLSRHRRTSHLANTSAAVETISANSSTDSCIQVINVNDHPHAIKNILRKNRKTISSFRIMLHAIKRKHKALREMGNKFWRSPPRLRELLLKQRRRIRRQQEERQLKSELNDDPDEALDLSLKHDTPQLESQPMVPQAPEITTQQIGLADFSSIFHLMLAKTPILPAFPLVSLPPPPLPPPPPPPPPSSLIPLSILPTLPSLTTQSLKVEPSSSMATHRKKNSYKDAPKLITCPVDGCNQKFPWNSSLKRHILTHTPHKPFACTRCTKSFSTKSNRERHMERVHRVSLKRCHQRSSPGSFLSAESFTAATDLEAGAEGTEYLREEEIASMRGNDLAAEDISNRLLKSAGSPLIEPNPQRLANQHRVDAKTASPQSLTFEESPTAMMCPVCGRSFGASHSLRRHLKTHLMA